MKQYKCKKRGTLTSEACFACFPKMKALLGGTIVSRAQCVKQHVTEKIDIDRPAEPVEPSNKPNPRKGVPMARKVKSAKESPYKYCAELLLEEKHTYDEIYKRIMVRFPKATNFPRARISTVLTNLNEGRWGGMEKPKKPIQRIVGDKPAAKKPAVKAAAKPATKPAVKPAAPKAAAKPAVKAAAKPAPKPAVKPAAKPAAPKAASKPAAPAPAAAPAAPSADLPFAEGEK